MAIIAELIRAGVDPDLVQGVVDALVAAAWGSTSTSTIKPASARQAKWRLQKRLQTSTEASTKRLHVDLPDGSPNGSPKEDPPHPLKKDTLPFTPPLPSVPPCKPLPPNLEHGFEVFWARYGHKVGKRKALEAFKQACRRADLADILDGLERYVLTKPPDVAWCNPATWLGQDRWTDEPAYLVNGHDPPAGRSNGIAGFLKGVSHDIENDRRNRASEESTCDAFDFFSERH